MELHAAPLAEIAREYHGDEPAAIVLLDNQAERAALIFALTRAARESGIPHRRTMFHAIAEAIGGRAQVLIVSET